MWVIPSESAPLTRTEKAEKPFLFAFGVLTFPSKGIQEPSGSKMEADFHFSLCQTLKQLCAAHVNVALSEK